MRDWDEHRLVLAVHRGGTLRAATATLGVTHTTVLRRLNALEQDQHTPLFTRAFIPPTSRTITMGAIQSHPL